MPNFLPTPNPEFELHSSLQVFYLFHNFTADEAREISTASYDGLYSLPTQLQDVGCQSSRHSPHQPRIPPSWSEDLARCLQAPLQKPLYNQNTQQCSENRCPHTSGEVAESTEVPVDLVAFAVVSKVYFILYLRYPLFVHTLAVQPTIPFRHPNKS